MEHASQHSHLDIARLSELLAADGPLAAVLGEKFEYRSGQQKMLQVVAEHFNREEIGLVEGGTGIGKSLAYLLPAICWAMQNGEQVYVATPTINLQQQLLEDFRLAV